MVDWEMAGRVVIVVVSIVTAVVWVCALVANTRSALRKRRLARAEVAKKREEQRWYDNLVEGDIVMWRGDPATRHKVSCGAEKTVQGGNYILRPGHKSFFYTEERPGPW